MKITKLKMRLLAFISIMIVCFSVFALSVGKVFSFADEVEQTSENNHCNATLADEFTDDSVIIVLDSEISEVNKVHNSNFFEGADVDHIIDLTKRKDKNANVDVDFRQVLQLYIKNGSKEKVLKTIAKLEKIEGIFSAEPNYLVKPDKTANETYFSNSQWNLLNGGGIDMLKAWDYSQGSRNIRVGVIDTGIANHFDLTENLENGYDYRNNNSITNDDVEGHGTKVAGIIGAKGNNGVGVAGINWNVTLVPFQVSYFENNECFIDINGVSKAINYATEQWGTDRQIDILNYSVSGFGKSTSILSMIKQYPGLFVWSAGNDGKNVDEFPSIDMFSLDNLISVGAIDGKDERSVWTSTQSSNYGSKVNIFAPGGKGMSKDIPGQNIPTTDNNNSISTFNGTSAAAPHVTGVAALLLSMNHELTASQLKEIILLTASTITITVPLDGGGTTQQTVKKLNAGSAAYYVYHLPTFSYTVHVCNATYYTWKPVAVDDSIYSFNLFCNQSKTITAASHSGYDFKCWVYYPTSISNANMDASTLPVLSNERTVTIKNLTIVRNEHYDLVACYTKSCVAEGSLITLADGSQKAVEKLTGDESLLVWNFFTGNFDSAPILFIDNEAATMNEVINLEFSDGTTVKVISEHGFWDLNLNEYVYLRNDAAQYLGHYFSKQTIDKNGKLTCTDVELVDVFIIEEYTSAWSPVTYGHLCYYVNGMLTVPGGIEGMFNIFEVDSNSLKYDENAYKYDIETYGLYTYEEFSDILYVSEEMFNAVNGQYLKVALGKNLIDFDTLSNYIERYSKFITD